MTLENVEWTHVLLIPAQSVLLVIERTSTVQGPSDQRLFSSLFLLDSLSLFSDVFDLFRVVAKNESQFVSQGGDLNARQASCSCLIVDHILPWRVLTKLHVNW